MSDEFSLYKPEKYKIVLGKKTNLALCTLWNDPFTLVLKEPKLQDRFSIVGSLYSKEGVSIIIRNLALNPHINKLIIWGSGKLSQTAIGVRGKNTLLTLWSKKGSLSDLDLEDIHKEIDICSLKKVISAVEVVDMSVSNIENIINESKPEKLKMYMKPVSFPDPKRSESTPFPSEKSNFSVRSKELHKSWLYALDRIMRYGYKKRTQAGIDQKELISISWTTDDTNIPDFKNIDWPEKLKKKVGIDKDVLDQYSKIFLDKKKPEDVSYTYGNRLRDYLGKLDQIEGIITKINEESITRRAYATTFDPIEDSQNPSPPCLISIQTLVDDEEKIHMIAYFRSHDILKAALPNAYGLLKVLEYISKKTQLTKGTLTIHSTSAHIYEDDFEDAEHLLNCALRARPKLYFDENEDIDPRGMLRIEVKNKKIYCRLIDEKGFTLHSFSGKSARTISMNFSRLGLLSKHEHTIDMAIELTKAEFALKMGKEYIQDKPFIFDEVVIK